MRKFTIFTIILTIVVVIVAADVFVNDYLPNLRNAEVAFSGLKLDLPNELSPDAKFLQTNVLGADIDVGAIPPTDDPPLNGTENLIPREDDLSQNIGFSSETLPVTDNNGPTYAFDPSEQNDFENENFNSAPLQNVLLRDDQIKSAGFTGAHLETEAHNGFLYKTIYVDDLKDVKVTKNVIKTPEEAIAKVYVMEVGPLNSVNDVYDVLKMRGAEGLDIELNETNEFGAASFYINDSRRPDVAFLTVKIGANIYGFSYPKQYHAQIKNLIILLDLEF